MIITYILHYVTMAFVWIISLATPLVDYIIVVDRNKRTQIYL